MRVVLASASPRRAELLRAAGIAFETCAVTVDESARPGESAPGYVRRLALEKSALGQAVVPDTASAAPVIIGADTAVVGDGQILGKPRDAGDAERMLRRLAGTRHDVLTGVSVRRGASEIGCVESTAVFCAALTEADIAWYVASGEGRDKAGGYAIQGRASRFITRIEGSYSNVVGLPIAALFGLLRQLEQS